MASQISVFSYQTQSGKKWGYRFEIAQVRGKRKWQTARGFSSKAGAFSAGVEAQAQYENRREVVIPSDISYADFLDVWIKSQQGILKVTTLENYQKKINLYIVPYLGGKKLNSINKEDLRTLLFSLFKSGRATSDCGLSENTLSVIKGIIKKSFAFAVEEKYLTYSPAEGRLPLPSAETFSDEPTPKSKPHVYIPPIRIRQIFGRFPRGTPDHIALLLGYKCGLRIGEAFAVKWEDIDFDKKTLTVNHQIQWKQSEFTTDAERADPKRRRPRHEAGTSGFWYLSPPKYNSKRTIYIDDDLIQILWEEREQQLRDKEYYGKFYFEYKSDSRGRIIGAETGEGDLHFVNIRRDGELISPRTMQHTSRVIHKDLNYPEFDFHSLRHTHATMLVDNGAEPTYVQHRLGHKNLEVTMRVYYHYTDQMEESGISVIKKMYSSENDMENNGVESST